MTLNTMTKSAERLMGGARRWQSEAFSDWVGLSEMDAHGNTISTEKQRGVAAVATGGGKTYLAMMVSNDWVRVHGDDAVVILVAPGGNLCNQHYRSFRDKGLTGGRYFTGYKEVSRRNLYITTYHSLKHVLKLKNVVGRKCLLILDECHKAGATGSRRTLLAHDEMFDAVLGLSATPERGDGVDVMHFLKAPIFFRLTLMDAQVQSKGEEAANRFRLNVVTVEPSLSEQAILQDLNDRIKVAYHSARNAVEKAGGQPNNLMWKFNEGLSLKPILLPNGEKRCPLQHYKNLTQRRKRVENDIEQRYWVAQHLLQHNLGKKMMLFHHSIIGVERINVMCKDNGMMPHIYHTGSSHFNNASWLHAYPELQDLDVRLRIENYANEAPAAFRRWTRSINDVLLSVKALGEGIDVPDLDSVIMLSGTNNHRSRVQTIGRVFRGHKDKEAWMVVMKGSAGDARCLQKIIEECGFGPQHIVRHKGSDFAPIPADEDLSWLLDNTEVNQ